jgi:hypothetical protein
MTKLKLIAMTAVAAVAIGVGGLVAAPPASAMYSCSQAMTMYRIYMAHGDVFMSLGNYSTAAAYYGRAQGVLEASC